MASNIESERSRVSIPTRIRRFSTELLMRPLGIKPFEDVETLINLSVKQFDNAQESIQIVEERFPAIIYGDPRMINALNQAEERGVKIELISGPERDKSSKDLEKMVRFQRATLYELDENPHLRFAIVDHEFVRTEDSSGDLDDWREGFFIKDKYHAAVFLRTFHDLQTTTQTNAK